MTALCRGSANSAMGQVGSTMGRGLLRGVKDHPDRAQLCVLAAAVVLVDTLGTVFYSRDIMAVAALGALAVLWTKE